jgi:hypothetical protein
MGHSLFSKEKVFEGEFIGGFLKWKIHWRSQQECETWKKYWSHQKQKEKQAKPKVLETPRA